MVVIAICVEGFSRNVTVEYSLVAYEIFYLSLTPLVVNGQTLNPVKSYLNADKDKESIYNENRNKIGVYC